MEHQHFVTFEQDFISIRCYETTLYYQFNNENELSILKSDCYLLGSSKKETETIFLTLDKSYGDKVNALKTFLIEFFSHSSNCFGYPIFCHSELITKEEFEQILKQGINNINNKKNNMKENDKKHPLILYCTEQNLYPEPIEQSLNIWKANCPSGRQHHIEISTSTDTWGCGYCMKKGGVDELKQWVNNIIKNKEQSKVNKSNMSEGDSFLERLKAKGYSTDKIGQGFVIHLPQPKRDDKKYNK